MADAPAPAVEPDTADLPGPAGRPAGDRWRLASRTLGELFISVGVLLLLFCAYQLWWTNVTSERATEAVRAQILHDWSEPAPVITAPATGTTAAADYGSGFALLYIPRLRDKVWGLPVIEGVGLDVLAEGAGHYPGTALPGQVGNFALAAHRATHAEPFRNFDQLQVGDKVYVQTRAGWFTYVLTHDKIVPPDSLWVVDPVPGQPGATPTQRLITLTTCNPRWASYQRWIWWGQLESGPAPSATAPPGVPGTA